MYSIHNGKPLLASKYYNKLLFQVSLIPIFKYGNCVQTMIQSVSHWHNNSVCVHVHVCGVFMS